MKHQPWYPFYVNNWRCEPKLIGLSMAARGVWREFIDLMFLMDSPNLEGTEEELMMMLPDTPDRASAFREFVSKPPAKLLRRNGRIYLHSDMVERTLNKRNASTLRTRRSRGTLGGTQDGTQDGTLQRKEERGKRSPLTPQRGAHTCAIPAESARASEPAEKDETRSQNLKLRNQAEAVYRAFPKKRNPKKAKEVIFRQLKRGYDGDKMLADVQRFAAVVERTGFTIQFIKDPERWFAHELYADIENEIALVEEKARVQKTDRPAGNIDWKAIERQHDELVTETTYSCKSDEEFQARIARLDAFRAKWGLDDKGRPL